VRFLLDQAVPEHLVSVLEALSHQGTHVSSLGLSRALDEQLAVVARGYDVFVTLDLHKQEREWLAVHTEIVNSGVKVLRIRLSKREHGEDLRLAIIRQFLRHMERWIQEFTAGAAALITLGPSANRLSSRTADEVREMLAARKARGSPEI
jgi:predicted nuclease of predicted toxin-antitoxin system